MKHVIITGASKGLGLALTDEYLAENAVVHALSRSIMQVKGGHHYEIDLTKVDALKDTFTAIFEQIDASCTELILINNAGMVEPVGTVIENTPASLEKSVTLNLTAPMATSSLFLQKSQHLNVKKTVLNISSGAGRSPMEGWSAYCSGKAGLDMFTRTAAAEQSEENNPVLFLSLAPGIIDTGMQETIRSSSEDSFKHVDTFKSYKANGDLAKPETISGTIVHSLLKDDLENGALLSIRDYL
ncbi:(S)-benzoin forming benzil reductase [Geomicrobium sp. JCM 19039]|uniref:(S)-benzoin forming benzil reductase n=1 Tax=Geomicrobium sp. JCM 19039 TaxID=1460636 RepID=UPI00045F40BF|nr:(S)-benzoin forming benzil reductase [Geomicrobium sp. JCM 19039]GAK11767.1 oxidoreductase [Geomicrobium sp. JCM 19039]